MDMNFTIKLHQMCNVMKIKSKALFYRCDVFRSALSSLLRIVKVVQKLLYCTAGS